MCVYCPYSNSCHPYTCNPVTPFYYAGRCYARCPAAEADAATMASVEAGHGVENMSTAVFAGFAGVMAGAVLTAAAFFMSKRKDDDKQPYAMLG